MTIVIKCIFHKVSEKTNICLSFSSQVMSNQATKKINCHSPIPNPDLLSQVSLLKFQMSILVKYDQARSCIVKSHKIWSSWFKFIHVYSILFKSSKVNSSLIKHSQVWSSLLKSDQVWSSQIKSGQVWSCTTKFCNV